MKTSAKIIAVNAVIAALYAALTVAISPIAYGEIQARISEIFVFLSFYNKKYFPGLILGCFIANLFSPMLVYDITFGTAATALVCFGMYYCKKPFGKNTKPALFLAAFIGGAVNGLLVGFELHLAYDIPFLINAIYVFVGEFAVLLVGAVIFILLEKNPAVKNILNGKIFEETADKN